MIPSGAPLVMRTRRPSRSTTTESRLRSKSKGISSRLVYPSVFCGVWRTITSSSGLRMPVSNLLLRNPSSSARPDGLPKASRERSNDIIPVVSVPVLSLQSTSRLPRF